MRKYGRLIPCRDCGELKPRDAFHRSLLLVSNRLCKICSHRCSKEWRKKNPDRLRAYNKKKSTSTRKKVSYADLPLFATCRECGEEKGQKDFYPSWLAIHNYLCKPCAKRRGLPPKKEEARPALPDWSAA